VRCESFYSHFANSWGCVDYYKDSMEHMFKKRNLDLKKLDNGKIV